MNMAPILRTVAAALLLVGVVSCERDTSGLDPVPLSTDPVVFTDTFGQGVDFQAFLNTKLDAIAIDVSERHEGTASLRVTIPGPNETGWFAGGAFVSNFPRNLSGYNALTFWAKAGPNTSTLNVAGLANDNTGTSKYEASWSDIPVSGTWEKYVVPIPDPGKLVAERGLFYFAEGFENNTASEIWFDDVKFETVAGITNPRPAMTSKVVSSFVGATVDVDASTTFDVNGTDQTIDHLPGYFTFISSADTVVTTVNSGLRVVGPGTATVTAKLGAVDATGTITVRATQPPTVAAPTPQEPPIDVISLYSNTYSGIEIYNWNAFGTGTVTDLKVQGNDTKAYTGLVFKGIAFRPPPPNPPPAEPTPQVDASDMTHFHMDVWVPDAAIFRVKLVDFGADGRFGGTGDNADSEHELAFTLATDPPLNKKEWVQLDLPLSSFTGLQSTGHLAQLIISIVGMEQTVFIDNIYFHK